MTSRVNPNFPIPGVDQSSRGFRDNFAITKQELENIQDKQIQLTGDVISIPITIGNDNSDIIIPTRINLSNLAISGAVVYQGTWNASTNTPRLISGIGTKGWYYKVSVAGSTSIDGISEWSIGDDIIFDGTVWDKISGGGDTELSQLNDVNVSSITNNQILSYDLSINKWINLDAPYDIYGTFPSKPTDSQILWWITIGRAITLPANLTGAVASCRQEPASNVVLPILQNGTQVGSINFSSGQSIGTFTFASQITFSTGDILEVDGPSPSDITFFGPSWAFIGYR